MKLAVCLVIFLITNTFGNNESIDSESSDNTDNSDLPLCDSNDLVVMIWLGKVVSPQKIVSVA